MGVKKGDVVLIYMPLIPEAVIAILATVRLGAIHSVVFGGIIENYNPLLKLMILTLGFASRELCARINHAEPKVLIAASCGVEPNKVIK